jgi:hypothetical protein
VAAVSLFRTGDFLDLVHGSLRAAHLLAWAATPGPSTLNSAKSNRAAVMSAL